MDKHTRLRVTLGIDVKVVAPTGNTTAYKLRVVLEIHSKDRLAVLAVPLLSNGAVHMLPLLRGEQQILICVAAHRHIVEVPGIAGTGLNQGVIKGVGSDRFAVLRCVADGHAKQAAVLFKQCHGRHRVPIGACAPAGIRGLFAALYGQSQCQIAAGLHILTKGIIHQRTVGEGQKQAVRVLLCYRYNIRLADQRLAAGVHKEMGTQCLALPHNATHFVQGQVGLMAVFRRPAAFAMAIAGTGGIHQHHPGNVAVLLLPVGTQSLGAKVAQINGKGQRNAAKQSRVHLVQPAKQELVPHIVLILNNLNGLGKSAGGEHFAGHQLANLHQLHQIAAGVLVHIAQQTVAHCVQNFSVHSFTSSAAYIRSGTLIFSMVSTLRMVFFTAVHRYSRACISPSSSTMTRWAL